MSKPRFRPLRLNDTIPFGKYKELMLKEVVDTDPDYITWLLTSTETTLQVGAQSYYIYKLNNK